jgi:hypothetical protein
MFGSFSRASGRQAKVYSGQGADIVMQSLEISFGRVRCFSGLGKTVASKSIYSQEVSWFERLLSRRLLCESILDKEAMCGPETSKEASDGL